MGRRQATLSNGNFAETLDFGLMYEHWLARFAHYLAQRIAKGKLTAMASFGPIVWKLRAFSVSIHCQCFWRPGPTHPRAGPLYNHHAIFPSASGAATGHR